MTSQTDVQTAPAPDAGIARDRVTARAVALLVNSNSLLGVPIRTTSIPSVPHFSGCWRTGCGGAL